MAHSSEKPLSRCIEKLKREVWKKSIGNKSIVKRNFYYQIISENVLESTGLRLSKDTVRNFFEDKHTPSQKTLDIYSTYVLGGDEKSLKTLNDFRSKYCDRFPTKLLPRKYGYTVLIVVGIVMLVSLIIIQLTPTSTIPVDDRFHNSDLSELNEDGWHLFELDSVNLDLWDNPNYRGNGFLTLETHLGGPFLDNKDYDPTTINILRKEISVGQCCRIFVKIVDFNPYQRYQQAGFLLYFSESVVPSISYAFVGVGDTIRENGYNRVQAVKRESKYSNSDLFSGNNRSIVSRFKYDQLEHTVDSIVLQVMIENSEYSFLYKIDDNDYIPIKTVNLDEFPKPKFIGLAAFQGRPEIPFPIYPVADTIPAKFEYFKLTSCQ